jgi:uncharacterized membrane protein (DUF485 family)
MVLTVFVLQLSVIYLPSLQSFFSTKPLSPVDLAIALAVGVIVFAAIEVGKKWGHK